MNNPNFKEDSIESFFKSLLKEDKEKELIDLISKNINCETLFKVLILNGEDIND